MRVYCLCFLIALQLVWLGWCYYGSYVELSAAPRVTVAAKEPRYWLRRSCAQEPITYRGEPFYAPYYMDRYSWNAYKKARAKAAQELQLTLEVALREVHPPMVTRVYVNGVPLDEAVSQMQRGELPQQAKASE